MVAIFTGAGAGLERGSGSVAGGAGLLGSASLGRNGEQVFLNASTGNLVIQQRDEFLVGRGPDSAINRTYNSLGDRSDDNGDNWRQSTDRRVFGLTGSINSWGSTVRRRSADGSEITYAWNGSAYRATDGGGADETIGWTGNWVWTDGDTGVTETYGAYGDYWRLIQQSDTSGNVVTYSYSGDKLTRVATADGGYTDYVWSGSNIIQITTASQGAGVTRTRYGYDGYNRLTTVTVDLTPEDHSVADGNTYVTTYTYHGTSKLVASISQTDGSRLDIGYDGANRVTTLTQTVAAGQSRTTTIGYGAGYTNITDAAGQTTRLDYASGSALPTLDGYAYANATREAATINGVAANKYTLQSNGGWTAVYHGFTASQGETLSFGVTLQAVGDSTSQYLGLYSDSDGWGSNNFSSARIVSGPGQLVQNAGGLWMVQGLSTTQGTRVEITRTYNQSYSGGIYMYVDLPQGFRAGAAMMVADPQLLRTTGATNFALSDLANWGYGGVTRETAGVTIDGTAAYKYTAPNNGAWAGVSAGLYAAKGETHTFALSLQAVGSFTSQSLGLYGNVTGWGSDATSTARIVSGPGTLRRAAGGLFIVDGLSTTQATRIEVTRTYDTDESGGAYFYIDHPGGFRASSLIASAPNLSRRVTEPAAANQLTKITLPAAHSGAAPQTVQFGYNSRGDLVSVTDPAGNTTSYGHDANGNVVSETDALGNVVTRTYGSRNELLTETRVGSDQASGAGQHTSRFVYDSARRLRYVISPQGAVTEYHYDGYGQRTWEAQHTDRFYDVSGLAATTPVSEAQVNQWRGSFDKTQLHLVENRYDARGNLSQRVTYGGSDWYGNAQTADGYKHEYFTYDQAGQLLNKTIASLNTEYFVYDGLGRLRSSTDVNGGTTSIVFNDAASQTVVTLANGFVQTSTYDKAGNLVAFAEGGDFVNGATATYKYDQLGRLRMATDATGFNSYFLYDKVGRKVADINHYGHVTEYRYDWNDRLVASARYTNGASGTLPQLQDPNSSLDMSQIRPGAHSYDVWTWNVYDKDGRVIQTIDGSGAVDTFEYDSSNRLVRTTSYANKLAGWQLDSFKGAAPTSLVLPSASGADKVSRSFYDKDGRLVGALDGEGYLTRYVFDAAGQKVQEIVYANATRADLRAGHSLNDIAANLAAHPLDRSTRYVYDGQGLLRFTVDALNFVTEFRYEAGATWTALGSPRETIQYVGAIAPLGAYTVASVRGALASAGLTGHSGNRVGRTVFDSAGRAAYAISAGGGVTGFSYDALGQVIKTVEYANVLNLGNLPSKADMDGWASANATGADRITRNYYSDRGELRFAIDAEGFITRNDYDAAGRVVRTVRWSNAVAPADWWDIYTVNSVAGGPWVENNFSYDAAGRLAWSYDGEGNHRYFEYYANGLLAWDIAMFGHSEESRTLYVYDGAGRRTEEYRAWNTADQSVTRYGYDGHGNLTSLIDANGNPTYRSYDKLGRLVSQTDAKGGVTSFGYDAFGNITRTTDARGYSSYSYYDRLGRITHSRDAEDYVTETSYTVFGDVASVTRRYNKTWNGGNTWDLPGVAAHALDSITQFEYDRLGRLVKVIDAEGHFEQYTLNAFGQRTHVRNKLGATTVNSYDRRGLLVAETLPMASIHRDGWAQAWDVTNRFEYDARGNRIRMIEAAGLAEQRTTTYVYDRADRLVETRHDAVEVVDQVNYYNQGSVVPMERIRYDTRGNVVETVDALGARTLFYYDKLNRKVEQIDALGNMVSWRYDANGNLTHERRWAQGSPWHDVGSHGWPSATDQDRITNYSYDQLNRLKTQTVVGVRTGRWNGSNFVASTGDLATTFDYDANGNVVRTTDGNGVSTHNYYDRLGRKVRSVDGENYVTGWLYDAAGNVYHERRWALKSGYAGLDGWWDPSVHGEDRVTDFTYDRNGRRLTETRRSVDALHVDDSGNLQRISWDSTISYSYNGLGQVVRKIEATAAGLSWDQHATEYQYDGAGRLTRESRAWYVNQDGNWVRPTTDYSYDGLNNLTRSRQSGDGAWQGERVTRYAYKAGGRLSQMWDPNGAQFNYYHDVAGNVLVQTWDRRRSDESYQHEGLLYTRDVMGRVTSQALGSWYGYWQKGDRQDTAYDRFGQVSQRGLNGGWQEQFGYDRAGRLERSNSGDGVWRYYLYDAVGNQTLAIENEGDSDLVNRTTDHALYRAQNYNQSNAGNVYIDGLNVTINIYDRRGLAVETQMRQRQLSAGNTQNLSVGRSYNAFGEVASERDARGNTTNYSYNTMGRTLLIDRPAVLIRHEHGGQEWVRPTERFAYDLSGRLIASWDANSNRTTRALLNGTGYGGSDALVVREHHADGGVVRNGYDVFGDLRRTTDEIGRVKTREYDAMSRLIAETHANGLVEGYAYDLLGQRIHSWNNVYQTPIYGPPEDVWVEDPPYWDYYYGWVYPGGHWETHTPIIGYAPEKARTDYDVQGRVTRQIDIGGDTTSYSYTWYGWLGTSGMGTFGAWEQVTTYANGRTLVEQSDMFGHDIYKRDLGGHVFSFQYDQAGRMTSRSGGETLNYTYLNTGLVSSIYTFSGDYGSQNWTRKSTTYGYDASGNLTSEYSVDEGEESYSYYYNDWDQYYYYNNWSRVSQNAIAEYDALGRRTHWRDHGNSVTPDARIWYDYDAAGNVRRSYAEYRPLDANGNAAGYVATQDYWYRYDSMNRVVTAKGIQSGGQIVRGYQGTDYGYNQAGERAYSTRSAYRTAYVNNPNYDPYRGGYHDPYYGYYDPYYDDPTIAVAYEAEVRERYTYDGASALTSVRIAESGYYDNGDGTVTVTAPAGAGALKASYGNDLFGRATRQIDYLYDGDYNGTAAYDRTVYYNGKGQVWAEDVITRQGGDTMTSNVRNEFGYGSNYALGAVVSSYSYNYKNGNNSAAPDTSTTNTFVWYDGAVQSQIRYKPDASTSTAYTTNFYYNGSGHLISAQVNDGRPRTVTYTNDLLGQTIRRDESDRNYSSGDPHEVWYRFGGKQMGYTGNNGTLDTDYQSSVQNRGRTSGNGAFRFGASYGSSHADFDQSLNPINSYSQGGSGGSHTVRAGETLASIAANLWGDAALWYKIAEANGLSAAGSLAEGQRLTIPAGVLKNTHNARTLRPYDPSEVIGDASPTTPQPQTQKKGGKCGVLGAVLLVVIAVAVTIVTAGAALSVLAPTVFPTIGAGIGAVVGGSITAAGLGVAAGASAIGAAVGSIVSQGVGVATGLQDKFSWKAVAMAGISGGVGAGLGTIGGTGIFGAALRGALGSAISQGIGVATGLQSKFDWAGVAAAGIGAGAGQLAGGIGVANKTAARLLSSSASAIANAATRTLVEGSDFGDNVLASLPDVIGSTLGSMVAESVGDGLEQRRIDRIVQRAGFTGRREDTQVAREWTAEMLRQGLTAEQVVQVISADGIRQGLDDMNASRAGGISEAQAQRRAEAFLDGAERSRGGGGGSDRSAGNSGASGGTTAATGGTAGAAAGGEEYGPPVTLEEVIVIGHRNGPSGETVVSKTVSGGMQVLDGFVDFAQEHPILATIAFNTASFLTGGPVKTIATKALNVAGDTVLDMASDAVATGVQNFVTGLAEDHGWQLNVRLGGANIHIGAASIGLGGGQVAGSLVDVVAGGGVDDVVQRGSRIRNNIVPERPSPPTRRFWTRTVDHQGTRVYQRTDLIDPTRVDSRGRTNLQRMERGLAPLGPDGKSMNLHHMTQRADGPIAELTATFHQQNSRVIHINPNTTPSGINRTEFNRWRRSYWQTRANDFR